MKFLFIAGGSSATVFTISPLATALRNAGHDVLVAANEPLPDIAAGIGLPSVSIVPQPVFHFMRFDRLGNQVEPPKDPRENMLHTGRAFGRMAAAGLDALRDLARHWRPDAVVGGSMTYAAGLLAAHLGVPYVRQAWDVVPTDGADPGAEDELGPELSALGLTGLPDPALSIDVCPPSLRPCLPASAGPGGQLMHWVPGNGQRRVEPWMFTRPGNRRRVVITTGTRALAFQSAPALRSLVGQLARAGAEVLIAAPDHVTEKLAGELDDVHIGWLPLDVVAPTCDLLVHHGGGVTAMTAMNAGVPQLIAPEASYMEIVASALSGFGAGIALATQAPDRDQTEEIAAGCREILSDPRYGQRARILSEEMAALPTPADVALTVEKLAAG
ncbi:nucleotide disphospho-sugar-binding domain-containing protein [Streptomyces sp. NPDC127113]|uniref:nucleotide disphospho-sugar-binding domain-containing protein n=1 Tax=Streptomyces sp. NPDC127113 TaxID=3345365 RepID=UPI0036349782